MSSLPMQFRRESLHRVIPALLLALIGFASAVAQVRDEIWICGQDSTKPLPNAAIFRFDRELRLIASTDLTPLGANGWDSWGITQSLTLGPNGDRWVTLACSGACKTIARLDRDGVILGTKSFGGYPLLHARDRLGNVFVATNILNTYSWGSLSKLDPVGNTLWSKPLALTKFAFEFPTSMFVGSDQNVWFSGNHYTHGSEYVGLAKFSGVDGSLLAEQYYTKGVSPSGVALDCAQATPFASAWLSYGFQVSIGSVDFASQFLDTSIASTFHEFTFPSSALQIMSGSYNWIRVDTQGNPWMLRSIPPFTVYTTQARALSRFSKDTGEFEVTFDLGKHVDQFNFGATGEEVFGIREFNCCSVPDYELLKLSLVSGTVSSVHLTPKILYPKMLVGDPTGFVFANVVEQTGDNDGDGFTNRNEVAAGYNPYDAANHPGGPKAYVSFAPGNNAIVLTVIDPDGINDPINGLDPLALSLTIGPYGEVLPFLLTFLTSVVVTPDGKQVTATFGALPIPKNLKLPVEFHVADLQGATASDWHVTPPGVLPD